MLLQSGDQTYIDLAGLVHDLGDEAIANQLIGTDDALIDYARATRQALLRQRRCGHQLTTLP
jgi:hypothetical protein